MTVGEGVRPRRTAPAPPPFYRIPKKLVVVDDAQRCVGLITVKDIEKATTHPTRPRTSTGACASPLQPVDKGFERAEMLMAAGVDCLVVDTAHGHSELVLQLGRRIQRATQQGLGRRRQWRRARARWR